jgi:hypothetical protein
MMPEYQNRERVYIQTRRSVLFALPLAAAASNLSDLREESIDAVDFPYMGYSVSDRFGRRIKFFITKGGNNAEKLPAIVSVLGSGADSNFLKRGDRLLDGHRVLREVFNGKAHILRSRE